MPSLFYDGSGKPPPEQVALRAGPLSLTYENGTLRYIRLGEHEILRHVYAAVRDRNWGTVPAVLRDVTMDIHSESFQIKFVSDHHEGDIHFTWNGVISGDADGVVRFTFDGEALTTFQRNRVGFCVLHPMSVAGVPCDLEHTGGVVEKGSFPQSVSPHQPYFDLRSITHEVLSGLRAEVRMEGDTFEMEDQRNWTDASYKTYCTPLAQPFPVLLEAGTKVHQSITLWLIGQPPVISQLDAPLVLEVGETVHALPQIGLGTPADSVRLTSREVERLKALHLAHLRFELHMDESAQARLQQVSDEAKACGCALELAVHLGDDLTGDLAKLKAVLDAVQPPVARLLIFRKGEIATTRDTVAAARHALDAYDIPIGAGTDAFFTHLNRNHPPADLLDWVVYSLNPQVHAFDNASLVETLPVQAVTVESARRLAGNAHIAVSPVTLKMRWSPDATAAEAKPPEGVMPKNVDVRQLSLFGAGWTLGSIKWLAQAGADSLTYYETVGWGGVMERESGSSLPDQFPSIPGSVFPMYHVFADVGAFGGGEVIGSLSSQPLVFDGLLLSKGESTRLLLANFTASRQSISVRGLTGKYTVHSLDETNVEQSIREPEAFRTVEGKAIDLDDDDMVIQLLPYALMRLDRMA